MASITSKNQDGDCGVLLLGAAGQLGQILCLHWPDPAMLHMQSRRAGLGMITLDPLQSPAALEKASLHMNSVVCLSGVTPAHAEATGDAMGFNTDLALAAIAAAPPGVRVFVTSSAAVYGAADGPHSETDVVAPVSDYGRAKRAMEVAALAAGGGRVCVLRIGNVVGADAILGDWHPKMAIDQLPDGRTPQRSYIGPKTLARVIHRLCLAPDLPDILNIAAPGLVEMGALLDKARRAWLTRKPTAPVIAQVGLDTSALERIYRFAPQECTAEGMVAQWAEGRSS
jgi:UDP-glucose 4-epimerase